MNPDGLAPQLDVDQLESLRRVVEDIASGMQLEPLLTRILERACALIGADDGTVGLYVPERDVIRTAAAYRMPVRELGTEMRRGRGLAGAVLERNEAVVARYGDLAQISLPELADNHVIGMPVRMRGSLIGFFGVGAWLPRRFAEHDIAILGQFAQHAAIAIDLAQGYADQRRRSARFGLIARVAAIIAADFDLDAMLQRAADAIHEVLEYPNVDIPLLDPDDSTVLVVRIRGGSYKTKITGEDRLSISSGIMGAAIRERRVQRVDDTFADARYVRPPGVTRARAELAVPIQFGEHVLGVVNVEGDAPFDALDETSLQIVAGHLAAAINNARLVQQAQQGAILAERQRLARDLHDNVTQILSSISLIAQSLSRAWSIDPAEGARRTTRLGELAQMAFAEMRSLLRELSPEHQDAPNISLRSRSVLGVERLRQHALPETLARLLRAMLPENIALELDFAGYRPQALAHEEALLRVCQEAVSNVIRHADACRLEIAAAVGDAGARLSIADDGGGIDADAAPGLGLNNMRKRLAELGGRLTIVARPPRGTCIEAVLPRADRELP